MEKFDVDDPHWWSKLMIQTDDQQDEFEKQFSLEVLELLNELIFSIKLYEFQSACNKIVSIRK